jgi:hypothetical protein
MQAWGFFAAIDQPLMAKARLTDFLKVVHSVKPSCFVASLFCADLAPAA